MLRLGVISELGTGENLGFARVSFDENEIVSGWLQLPSTNTKTAKQWIPVEVNSQVACLMDGACEQGCIVAVLWSATDTPPEWANADTIGVKYADGAEIYYDAKGHKLAVNAPDAELSIACKKLTVQGEVSITGDTKIDGAASITGDTKIDGAASIGGDTSVKGKVNAEGDISSQAEIKTLTVKLSTHMHPTAATGSPSPPTPGT